MVSRIPIKVFALNPHIGHAIARLPLPDLPIRFLLSGAHVESISSKETTVSDRPCGLKVGRVGSVWIFFSEGSKISGW
jgi:hypothetical protein